MCMGGDQTLFVTRPLFNSTGGFNASMKIMEEYEFCRRARRSGKYIIMDGSTLISARKYETNSWWQVQKANYTIIQMYKKGASQEDMVKKYREMLDYR
jgi:GT2 family glycosyltransferase